MFITFMVLQLSNFDIPGNESGSMGIHAAGGGAKVHDTLEPATPSTSTDDIMLHSITFNKPKCTLLSTGSCWVLSPKFPLCHKAFVTPKVAACTWPFPHAQLKELSHCLLAVHWEWLCCCKLAQVCTSGRVQYIQAD